MPRRLPCAALTVKCCPSAQTRLGWLCHVFCFELGVAGCLVWSRVGMCSGCHGWSPKRYKYMWCWLGTTWHQLANVQCPSQQDQQVPHHQAGLARSALSQHCVAICLVGSTARRQIMGLCDCKFTQTFRYGLRFQLWAHLHLYVCACVQPSTHVRERARITS